jgi:hypothetical protein
MPTGGYAAGLLVVLLLLPLGLGAVAYRHPEWLTRRERLGFVGLPILISLGWSVAIGFQLALIMTPIGGAIVGVASLARPKWPRASRSVAIVGCAIAGIGVIGALSALPSSR